MQIAIAIQHHTDYVMGIFHISLVLCPLQCPLVRVQLPFTEHQIAVAVIVTDILFVSLPIPHFHEPGLLCPERGKCRENQKEKENVSVHDNLFLIGVIFREVFSTPRFL